MMCWGRPADSKASLLRPSLPRLSAGVPVASSKYTPRSVLEQAFGHHKSLATESGMVVECGMQLHSHHSARPLPKQSTPCCHSTRPLDARAPAILQVPTCSSTGFGKSRQQLLQVPVYQSQISTTAAFHSCCNSRPAGAQWGHSQSTAWTMQYIFTADTSGLHGAEDRKTMPHALQAHAVVQAANDVLGGRC